MASRYIHQKSFHCLLETIGRLATVSNDSKLLLWLTSFVDVSDTPLMRDVILMHAGMMNQDSVPASYRAGRTVCLQLCLLPMQR